MFPKTRNIESSFRMIRAICMASMIGSFCFGGCLFFMENQALNRMQQRLYILANGKILEAIAGSRKDNIPVEARDHISTYHLDFFTLDPDEKVINTNLTKALYLADESGKRVYQNLLESGYYASVISSNISQRLFIDSIELNTMKEPFYFRLFAEETITRPTSIVTRELQTEGYLRLVSRSDNNSHGFLIERWSILSNRDVKTVGR